MQRHWQKSRRSLLHRVTSVWATPVTRVPVRCMGAGQAWVTHRSRTGYARVTWRGSWRDATAAAHPRHGLRHLHSGGRVRGRHHFRPLQDRRHQPPRPGHGAAVRRPEPLRLHPDTAHLQQSLCIYFVVHRCAYLHPQGRPNSHGKHSLVLKT